MRTCTVIFALLCLIGHAAAQRKGGRMNREEPLSSPATTGPSEPVPAIFFGLHIDHPESEWPPFPFGSYRFWDNFTRWQVVHKELDKFDWERTDYWIHKLDSHGIHDATYALGGSPPWAVNPTANSNSNSNCDYADPSKVRSPGPGYCLPPKDLNSDGTGTNLIWRKAVAGIAGHFRKSPIHMSSWEVWNEIVRTGDMNLTAAWVGTNQQMVRLSQDANCIITGRGHVSATNENCDQVLKTVGLKEPVDPSALIISPSGGLGAPKWVQRFNEYLATPGAVESVDVIGLHSYPLEAENAYNLVIRWKSSLSGPVASKPIWLTEGGWAKRLEDPDMQMAFVARFHLLMRSVGAGRVYWYAYDTPHAGMLMGTKAGVAYKQVYDWMVGNTVNGCSANGGIYTCTITKADGTPMMAVWDVTQNCSSGSCSTSNYKVPSKYTTYSTLEDRNPVPIKGGTVQIGAKPILLSAR